MLPFIKPIAIVLVFVTATGVLLHDLNIDKATKVAFAAPAALAVTGLGHSVAKMEHVHVERASAPKVASIFNSSLPKISPPTDDKRYVQTKKHVSLTGGDGQSYLWPSV
jgi:hypothetical protein